MVVHTYNPSTEEGKAGELQVLSQHGHTQPFPDHPQLQSETFASKKQNKT
jgi:hypothetical protein